jgi:predicted nucleotidyltransferase
MALITQEQIDEVKRRLVVTYNPLKIYIFGSYAWGTPNDDSDLDLMVILESSSEPKIHLRAPVGHLALAGMSIAKELIILTNQEFQERCNDENRLAYQVAKHGKLIYSRP